MRNLITYNRIFFHLYKFIYNINNQSNKWLAAFSAVLVLSLLLFINILLLFGRFFVFSPKIFTYLIFASIFIMNFSMFMLRSNYLKFELKYVNDSLIMRFFSLLCTLAFFLLAIVLTILDKPQ